MAPNNRPFPNSVQEGIVAERPSAPRRRSEQEESDAKASRVLGVTVVPERKSFSGPTSQIWGTSQKSAYSSAQERSGVSTAARDQRSGERRRCVNPIYRPSMKPGVVELEGTPVRPSPKNAEAEDWRSTNSDRSALANIRWGAVNLWIMQFLNDQMLTQAVDEFVELGYLTEGDKECLQRASRLYGMLISRLCEHLEVVGKYDQWAQLRQNETMCEISKREAERLLEKLQDGMQGEWKADCIPNEPSP